MDRERKFWAAGVLTKTSQPATVEYCANPSSARLIILDSDTPSHASACNRAMSTLASVEHAASQFGLLTSLCAFPGSVLAGFSGFAIERTGFT